MRSVTLVNLNTGEIGSVLGFPHHAAAESHLSKLPPGIGYVEGRFDRLSQRFDLLTRAVVDHQPEQPDDDHEWRAENPDAPHLVDQRWRWFKKREVIEREWQSTRLLRQIEDIEKLQVRSLSDLLDDPSDANARANYDRRKAEIAQLRQMRAEVISRKDR